MYRITIANGVLSDKKFFNDGKNELELQINEQLLQRNLKLQFSDRNIAI